MQYAAVTSGETQRRRLAPAPPDARWDPTALPSHEDDDEPRWTKLQLAAREGNTYRVNEILSRTSDETERQRVVNAPPAGWYGQTALQAACMHEREDVIRILLAAGADIGAPGGNNIYMNAFEGMNDIDSKKLGNIRLVRQLLDAGATLLVNPAEVTRYQGRTPIQAAAESGSQAVVDLLLELGADINDPPSPSAGRTALQAACLEGYLDMAKHLLANGADVNAAAAKHGGFTALEAACRIGDKEMLTFLKMLAREGQRFMLLLREVMLRS
ncbi:hypothetical protein N0V93_002121 [Gnomoniopsis smithogilvyi]|uniref:Ankyrin n=1 Tax=Gnomoniopsis smithogilvyi TaxID=1191159 RepID=A0A9W8Z3A7_9PEZI|nr:hypothetical protein N0V93_002121 [Gnomoniopsis smithogilvyi]